MSFSLFKKYPLFRWVVFLCLLSFILLLVWLRFHLHASIKRMEQEHQHLHQEIRAYTQQHNDKDLKEIKASLTHSLDVLSAHKAWQQRPILILNELLNSKRSSLVLTRLDLSKEQLFLEGQVMSHSELNTFIQTLESSAYVQQPQILSLKEVAMPHKHYAFVMTFLVLSS